MIKIVKKLLWIFVLLLLLPQAFADFKPGADIDLEAENITNATAIYADQFCYNNGTCFAIGTLEVFEGDTILIDWLSVVIALGLAILVIGLMQKDYTITNLGAVFLVVSGIFMISEGIQGVSNLTVDAFGIVLIGVGSYVMLVTAYEIYKEM